MYDANMCVIWMMWVVYNVDMCVIWMVYDVDIGDLDGV